MHSFRVVVAAGLTAAACAPSAMAADAVTVSRSSTVATFSGKWGVGSYLSFPAVESQLPRCLPRDLDCESTLVRVDDFGEVAYTLTENELTDEVMRIDLTVYESDAVGTVGAPVGRSTAIPSGTVVTVGDAESRPGWYLFFAAWHDGAGDYAARVELTPRPPET